MGYRNEHENIVPVFMYPDKENSCIINVLIKKFWNINDEILTEFIKWKW